MRGSYKKENRGNFWVKTETKFYDNYGLLIILCPVKKRIIREDKGSQENKQTVTTQIKVQELDELKSIRMEVHDNIISMSLSGLNRYTVTQMWAYMLIYQKCQSNN